jgi:hypothetical protein
MPLRPKIINKFGTLTGWNNITTNLFGRDLEGIESVKYGDEMDIGVAHGAGNMPIGKTRGNYTATSSISLYFEESTAIITSLPPGTRLQDIPDFDITVAYEFKGATYKDIIRNCSFKNNGREVKNGEGKIVTEYTLVPSHIDYNV